MLETKLERMSTLVGVCQIGTQSDDTPINREPVWDETVASARFDIYLDWISVAGEISSAATIFVLSACF